MNLPARKAPATQDTPVTQDTLVQLRALVSGLEREQLIWTSGYLAALAHSAPAAGAEAAASIAQPPAKDELWTVFFASETGNSRQVAAALHQHLAEVGMAARLQDLKGFQPHRLAKIHRAFFVVATHGLGDPPEGTQAIFDFLAADTTPQFPKLQYGVLALGDSSYADFCEVGRWLDERLTALGAERVLERVDCDLNFRTAAEAWSLRALQTAKNRAQAPTARIAHLHAVPGAMASAAPHSFTSRVLVNQRITGRGSSKEVRHIELDLEGSGIEYLPGDSLGVLPENPPEVVAQILDVLQLDSASEVVIDDKPLTLEESLLRHLEVTAVSQPLIKTLAAQHPQLEARRIDRDALHTLLHTHQVIDLLIHYPIEWNAQMLADTLRELPPRLYSIASSPDANPDEAHLTVGVVQYERFGRMHWGAASTCMARGADTLAVHLERNEQFRLPEDAQTPIIMIGAGTGVAPYRAFMEHRREHGHTGANWLVFGDRNFFTDFLYQSEWLDLRRQGMLNHLDLAFSRDGADKVYVQHRIAEQGRRLHDWLERGAHIYVCGDATGMGEDVHAAILGVLASEGALGCERAEARLAELRDAGRYQRDLY